MMHIHRWRKLGRHKEAKLCVKCGACRIDSEEFHKSRLQATLAQAVGKEMSIFNEEEMALLRSFSNR